MNSGGPGKTVRLFLVDGSPTGLITAEIGNWTGHVLVAPRSRLADAFKREEANRTGVYLLIGDDPDQPSKPRVYIGEGDSVKNRIAQHAQDESKDFWTRVCIITSKDQNLTKAHGRYLESRLIEIGKAAGRAKVANNTDPGFKLLPESDIADMEFFLPQVQVVLPVIQIDVFRTIPSEVTSKHPSALQSSPPGVVELVLSSPKHGVKARALEQDGEVTVLAGSLALAKGEFASNQYEPLRNQLIGDGRLKASHDQKYLEFAEDVPFSSPSAAAAVIYGRNANGRTEWKVKATGQTLKEWQDAQLHSLSTGIEAETDG